jgi:D-alanine-D-alanine ligase
MTKERKIKLGILFGGRSGEHEISVTSAASVIRALDLEEFDIAAIGITKSGKLATREETSRMLPEDVRQKIAVRGVLQAPDARMLLCAESTELRDGNHNAPEIIFPLLHGPYGEDGTVQGLLEVAGLPYIGCGVLASAVGMDKDVMKRLFVHAGLPVLPYVVIRSKELEREPAEVQRRAEAAFGYPMFSKPANLGSSVGIRKIHSASEFLSAAGHASRFDQKIVIEKGVDARELECAVLGNEDAQASVVGEVVPGREFYDYEAKYRDSRSTLEIPARLAPAVSEQIRDIALRAFRAIDGSGLARVDFFVERDSGKVWLNEINTMPGFTEISMYAKLWAHSGVGFGSLVRKLVAYGLERHSERDARRISESEQDAN